MQKQTSYAYFLTLCDAIATFASVCENKDPNAFFYRQVNLRFAVERSIFFTCLEDHALQSLFEDFTDAHIKPCYVFDCAIKMQIARYLAPSVAAEFKLKQSLKSRLKYWALSSKLGNKFLQLSCFLLKKCYQKTSPDISNSIVTYIIHEKFIRYMQPIANKLGKRFNIILHAQPKLIRSIAKANKPFYLFPQQAIKQTPSAFLKEFYGLVNLFENAYQAFSKSRPKAILVPEGDAPQFEVLNQVGHLLNIPCYCIQHGSSSIVHSGFRNMHYSKMLVWGNQFAELLKPYNPKQEFVTVGSHIIETNSFQLPEKPAIAFFLQCTTALINETAWNEFIELIEYAAQHFNYSILVREHPGHPLKQHEKERLLQHSSVKLQPPATCTLEDILNQSVLSVSIYSTVILESLAKGVPPLIVNLTGMPHYVPDIAKEKVAVEVFSLEEAKQALHKLLDNKDCLKEYTSNIERIKPEYFAFNQSKALTNIIATIDS